MLASSDWLGKTVSLSPTEMSEKGHSVRLKMETELNKFSILSDIRSAEDWQILDLYSWIGLSWETAALLVYIMINNGNLFNNVTFKFIVFIVFLDLWVHTASQIENNMPAYCIASYDLKWKQFLVERRHTLCDLYFAIYMEHSARHKTFLIHGLKKKSLKTPHYKIQQLNSWHSSVQCTIRLFHSIAQ